MLLLGYWCTCKIGYGFLSPRRESLQIHSSATREKVEEGSTAGKPDVGQRTDPGASEAVDAIAALIDDDNGARAQSRKYADGEDSPRDPFEGGLEPSPE